MTLRDQIREFHLATFGREFHAHRGGNVPAMVNDLTLSIFDDLQRADTRWIVSDSLCLRAIKEARRLMETMSLRRDTPAVE
jgi:hypothetical protein